MVSVHFVYFTHFAKLPNSKSSILITYDKKANNQNLIIEKTSCQEKFSTLPLEIMSSASLLEDSN